MHPYREPPAEPPHARVTRDREEWVLYGLLVVVGAIPVVLAIAGGTAFGTAATIGLAMVVAGLIGLVGLAAAYLASCNSPARRSCKVSPTDQPGPAGPRAATAPAGTSSASPPLNMRAASTTSTASGDATTILVVEDEAPIRRFLRAALSAHGFLVVEADTIAEAEHALARQRPAAILLDLGLPDGDGLELLRRIRAASALPIIIISARDRERDKVHALDAGADDYVTKPFAPAEVLARIRVAIRHAAQRSATPSEPPILECGPIRVDRARHAVTRDGAAIHLTPIEFQLLVLLMRHDGRLITYAQMLTDVLGASPHAPPHQLRVHMSALRRKLEANPARPQLLRTETGIGYRICRPED